MITETPKDLNNSLVLLEKLLPKNDLKRIKEHFNIGEYHHNLGRSIRNNWGLWSNTCLSTWFKNIGVNHPDSMSAIILDALHRKLNDKPFELDVILKDNKYD